MYPINPLAANKHLTANFDPRFPQQSIDQAKVFAQQSQAAANAVGAAPGSIAARENPLRYGSVAGRENPQAFGQDAIRALDAVNTATSALAPPEQALARRGMSDSFSAGNFDALQSVALVKRRPAPRTFEY